MVTRSQRARRGSRAWTLITLAAGVLAWPSSAAAAPITLTFTALITFSEGPSEIALGERIDVGDYVNGTFTFERTASPTCANCSTAAGPPYGLRLATHVPLLLDESIVAGWLGDPEQYFATAATFGAPDGGINTLQDYGRVAANVRFADPSLSASPTGFPADLSRLADFPIQDFWVDAWVNFNPHSGEHGPWSGEDFLFGGVLTSVDWNSTASPVPEPGTLLMLSLAGAVTVASSRVRRSWRATRGRAR